MLKRVAILIIKGLLWLLDKDHRTKEVIEDDNTKKFTHVQWVNFRSDYGKATSAYRTVPYQAWLLRTKNRTLIAADKHRVINDQHLPVWIEDLKPGDKIKTSSGIDEVVECRDLGFKTHMYCISVSSDDPMYNQLYYTDGILSHNTECAVGFLLWYAMFVPGSTILIAANIYDQALEIMKRARFAYESLPDYIRAGVKFYAKESIEFDNGSVLRAQATTENTGRGKSISVLYCLDGDSVVTVRNKETGEVKDISLADLYLDLLNDNSITGEIT